MLPTRCYSPLPRHCTSPSHTNLPAMTATNIINQSIKSSLYSTICHKRIRGACWWSVHIHCKPGVGKVRPAIYIHPARGSSSVLTLNPAHLLPSNAPKDERSLHAKRGFVAHRQSTLTGSLTLDPFGPVTSGYFLAKFGKK